MTITNPVNRFSYFALLCICIIFLLAGLARLNDLSLYTPDSIRYVIWGNSIAQGKGFVDDTEPDPLRFVVHAPFYSVLLVPVEFFFPLSLTAVKVFTVMCGVFALVIFYLWLHNRFGLINAVAGTLLLACNPLLLVYSSEALSEAPFIALFCLILISAERVASGNGSTMRWLVLLLCIAVIGLLREVGIALVLGTFICFLLHKQFLRSALVLVVAGVSLGAWYIRNQVLVGVPEGSSEGNAAIVLQHFVTAPDTPFIIELMKRMWLSFAAYAQQLGGMLFFPLHGSSQVNLTLEPTNFSQTVRMFVILIVSPLMLFGIYADFKQRKVALFRVAVFVCYLGLILSYPIHDIRFLFPLFPLVIFYILVGVEELTWYFPQLLSYAKARYVIPGVLLTMMPNLLVTADIIATNSSYNASSLGFYERITKLSQYPTMYSYPWSMLETWIRDSIPEAVVIASPSKQLAIIAGNRKVLEMNPGITVPIFEKTLRDNGVGYLLTETRWENYKYYEFLMNESRRFQFDSIYSVANLHLMKVTSRLKEKAVVFRQLFTISDADSGSASRLLRLGRKKFLETEYQTAIQLFKKGNQLVPDQPEFVYHIIVACTFLGDSSEAQQQYEKLLTFPQASSYLYLAKVHMDAMYVALSAKGVPPTQERAITMSDLARLYWDLGYAQFAKEMSNQSLQYDSTYFWGLLWGFHFNFQLGDTVKARYYYKTASRIEENNQVVESFKRLLAIGDSLQFVDDHFKRSALHLSAAKIYRLIELFEESIDEAERSLDEDSNNRESIQLLAEAFEKKGKFPLSASYYSRAIQLAPHIDSLRVKYDSIRTVISQQ